MQRPRTPSRISESLHRQLNSYALAASAAGVSLAVLAQPAEGKIVYTPAHRVIHRGDPGILQLDLNHDGVADFKFENWWHSDTDLGPAGSLSVFPSQGVNGIRGYGTENKFVYFASALPAGERIGSKEPFVSPNRIDWMLRAGYGWGQWNDVKNSYLGLKFVIKGKTHYGWARLNVHSNPTNFKINAVLTGYAYETIPNRPIITGKTHGGASLGALAAGSPALSSRQHKIRSR
jgi:hypothetical protein